MSNMTVFIMICMSYKFLVVMMELLGATTKEGQCPR